MDADGALGQITRARSAVRAVGGGGAGGSGGSGGAAGAADAAGTDGADGARGGGAAGARGARGGGAAGAGAGAGAGAAGGADASVVSGDAPPALSANQVLAALTLLRELRTEIAGWEPELIEAARALGTSWADLAPALGVTSRQAAERRYLRLRPAPDGVAGTGDQRVAAERDKRAGDRAVALWARDNAAGLRQLAGQIGALTDLGTGAAADLTALHDALGRDDAADLLGPLAGTRGHLRAGHPGLADQVGRVGDSVAEVRAASDRSRRPGRS